MIHPISTSIVPTKQQSLNGYNADGYSKGQITDFPVLTLSQCFALNANGLVVTGTPSITEWLQVGERLRKIEKHIQFAIGDWLNYGKSRYGEMYSQALEETDYTKGALRDFAWVSRQVAPSLRKDNLTFSHHKEVAAFTTEDNKPDVEKQQEWLEKAAIGDGEKPWSVSTLRNAIKDAKQEADPTWLKHSDVWNFTACDERFGLSYPGRIPGQIVLNVLHYYTAKDDLVVDPMAGGGVTIDACKELNRFCFAFDRQPIRDDIAKRDATEAWPELSPVSLVFIDPPYFSQMAEDYGGVSKLNYPLFLEAMECVFRNAYAALKSGGVLAILIAPTAIIADTFLDTTFDFVQSCKDIGFEYTRRISVPVSTQQIAPQVMEANRNNGILNAVIRDLIILRK